MMIILTQAAAPTSSNVKAMELASKAEKGATMYKTAEMDLTNETVVS